MASRRRVAVALLFTAAGITPMVALGSAWGGQGFTAQTAVTVDGRTAATFPGQAKEATTVPAAAVPQLAPAPAASSSATSSAAAAEPSTPTATATKTQSKRPEKTKGTKPAPTTGPSTTPSGTPSPDGTQTTDN